MRKIRNCTSAQLNTGGSACRINWDKILGAILVEPGKKLPADITAETLMEACHADRPDRIYPIVTFTEYSKNGGEPQVSAEGYGANMYNGMNARTDTFTLNVFDEMLNASLLRTAGKEWDVYYFDKSVIYGYNDGTDILAGIPMSTVYPTATPHPTSSAKASLTVSFCHKDAEDNLLNLDYVDAGVNLSRYIKGLTEVNLVEQSTGKFRVIEAVGGYDRTPEFGQILSTNATELLIGASTATYENGMISATSVTGMAAPSVLFENDVKWIECVGVIKSS